MRADYTLTKLCPWRDWNDCIETRCPFYQPNIIPTLEGHAYVEFQCSRTKQIDELKELIKELKNVKTKD